MSYSHAVTADHPLCGTWFAYNPDETNFNKAVEYHISVVDGEFRIKGMDHSSGEEIIICDLAYDGEWIRFQSLRPSSGRNGCNWIRVLEKNRLEFRFTFTGHDFLARKRRAKDSWPQEYTPSVRRGAKTFMAWRPRPV